MASTKFTYWRSKDGGPWERVNIRPGSIIAHWLAEHPGGIYDDDYGNRYRCEELAS